jgi:hypothetical protein
MTASPLDDRSYRVSALLYFSLAAIVILYAFLAGLRTLSEFDLGWQLATGRWIVQHHEIPSIDVFSYTASGEPWIYPVGSGLLFYVLSALGTVAALSWLGAVACAGTVALLLRRGSTITAALAVFAVALIAIRTRPRADMFTVVLFAAFLSLLWQQHRSGRGPLWLLPLLMVAWVNLHLGFVAGFAAVAAYVMVEVLEMIWPDRRAAAGRRMRRCWPWLVATLPASLVNPWGWNIYGAVLRQENFLGAHSQWIAEWGPAKVNWTLLSMGLSLRDTVGAFHLMLLIAAVAVAGALWQKQFGAAILLGGAATLAVQHIRFEALFAIVVVIVGGAVLTSAGDGLRTKRLGSIRASQTLTIIMAAFVVVVAFIRSADLVRDRTYLANSDLGSFGTGLSWWFPERAAAFIGRENLPGQIFTSYNLGGYLAWQLGPRYADYIDGRAIPFGVELLERNRKLMTSPPNSPDWLREIERYDINTVFVPLGRYNGIDLFPRLREFCASTLWRPIYLDEVSAVFVRVRPENRDLIARLQIRCETAPLPAIAPHGDTDQAFDQWANAATVLMALGRYAESFDATTNALRIFPDSAFVHFLRANLWGKAGNLAEAEREFLLSAKLEPNAVTWATLAAIYRSEGRATDEAKASERAHALSAGP